jgi:phosphoglycerol transferase
MRLWEADFDIPFSYSGDGLLTSMLIKGLIDNGWIQHNNFIGLPAGQDLSDFPINNYLDFIFLKFLLIFAPKYAVLMNTYYLLTFPLTTITAIFVFRQFNTSYNISIFGGLLYAFLPYHFLRGEPHLGLAAYYMVPLIILVVLWLCEGKISLINGTNNYKNLQEYRSIASIVICMLVSYTFIYYSFFSCFFILVAGITAFISQRNKYSVLNSIILVLIIILGVLISLSPTLIYQHENGKNFEAATRDFSESELYGLKIIQLLMPISEHRIPMLAKISSHYSGTAPLINENQFAALCIFGGMGFLALIALAFFQLSKGSKLNLEGPQNILNSLTILNLSAVLLATIGGFGSIFAYSISEGIRCYNRISIFIAFFSILAIVIFLGMFSRKYIKSTTKQLLFNVFICLALVVGIFDQTSDSFVPHYESNGAEYSNDENFINNIEAIMPENAIIFQLPYVPFPENPPVNRMNDYSHFRAYLHSKDLRWSYGAMKGRPGDDWQRLVASMPVSDMLKTLSQTGFGGIYVDSYGFEDSGSKEISDIKQILEIEPIISENGRLYFFDMTNYNKRDKDKSSDMDTAFTGFGFGWYGQEDWAGIPTRWMQSDSEIVVFSPENRTSTMSMSVQSFYRSRTLMISSGDSPVAQIFVPTSFINASVPISLKKGVNTVLLHVPEGCERPCDMPELNSVDSRFLSVAMQNLDVDYSNK